VMRTVMECFDLLETMAKTGNPNSVSDTGVGALCVRAAVHGAGLNVQINLAGLDDEVQKQKFKEQMSALLDQADLREKSITDIVSGKLN